MTFNLDWITIVSMKLSFQNKKALVVDNSSIITKIIKNFLIQTGFEKGNIFVAHDRNQALMMSTWKSLIWSHRAYTSKIPPESTCSRKSGKSILTHKTKSLS